MNEDKNPLQPEIDGMKASVDAFNKKLDEAVKESPDVKEGLFTEEEKKNEAPNVLYNAITQATIEILSDVNVINAFKFIDERLTAVIQGKHDPEGTATEIMQRFTTIFAIAMTNSAYQAILFYDDLLKAELTKQFEAQAHHININKADVEACRTVVEMLRIHSNKISDTIKIDRLVTDNKVE